MDGILIVDKPKGFTSHDIVDFVRKRFGIKKVGHAGTLDPGACGVLVLLLGRFTKAAGEFTNQDKEYQACLTLGITTGSQDAEGRVIKREKPKPISLEQAERVFGQFLGRIEQIPPMFSALKYKGIRLYKLARQGLKVSRPGRQVYIRKLKITNFKFPSIYFLVSCSKGTYVRTLCADIAERLDCAGYMSQLRRIRVGRFTIAQSISLDRLRNFSPQRLHETLITTK